MMTPTQRISPAPIAVPSSLASAKRKVGSQAELAEDQRMVRPTPFTCSCLMSVGQGKLET